MFRKKANKSAQPSNSESAVLSQSQNEIDNDDFRPQPQTSKILINKNKVSNALQSIQSNIKEKMRKNQEFQQITEKEEDDNDSSDSNDYKKQNSLQKYQISPNIMKHFSDSSDISLADNLQLYEADDDITLNSNEDGNDTKEYKTQQDIINNKDRDCLHACKSHLFCPMFSIISLFIIQFMINASLILFTIIFIFNHSSISYQMISGKLLFIYYSSIYSSNPISYYFVQKFNVKYSLIIYILICTLSLFSLALYFTLFEYSNNIILYVCLFMSGISHSFFNQSMNTIINDNIPVLIRQQFNNIMISVRNIGYLMGCVCIGYIFNLHALWIIMSISCISILFICAMQWTTNLSNGHSHDKKTDISSIISILSNHGLLLFSISIFSFSLMFVQNSRWLLLTFQSLKIELNIMQIAGIHAISFVPNIVLFPLPAYIMNKYGRKYCMIPSLFLFSIALVIIPYCNTMQYLMFDAILYGMAEVFTNHLIITVGMDIMPIECNAFFTLYQIIANFGCILSPLVIGYICTYSSIENAAIFACVIGLVSLLWCSFGMEEPKIVLERRVKHYEHVKQMNVSQIISYDERYEHSLKDIDAIEHQEDVIIENMMNKLSVETNDDIEDVAENNNFESLEIMNQAQGQPSVKQKRNEEVFQLPFTEYQNTGIVKKFEIGTFDEFEDDTTSNDS